MASFFRFDSSASSRALGSPQSNVKNDEEFSIIDTKNDLNNLNIPQSANWDVHTSLSKFSLLIMWLHS